MRCRLQGAGVDAPERPLLSAAAGVVVSGFRFRIDISRYREKHNGVDVLKIAYILIQLYLHPL